MIPSGSALSQNDFLIGVPVRGRNVEAWPSEVRQIHVGEKVIHRISGPTGDS